MLEQLRRIRQRLCDFEESFPASSTNSCLDRIEFKLAKIDSIESRLETITEVTTTSFKEIKDANTNSEKTWAQIAATNTANATTTTTKATIQAKRRELNETLRKQREPYQVPPTTTNDKPKKILTDTCAREITKRIIDAETIEKPKLNVIDKITNGIWLQCKSPEDAQVVRTANWNSAFEGLTVH